MVGSRCYRGVHQINLALAIKVTIDLMPIGIHMYYTLYHEANKLEPYEKSTAYC